MSVSHSNALRLEVAQRTVIARDVVEIDFAHGEKAALPEVSPGAHLLVHLSPELSRQYSLCNGPADRDVSGVLHRPPPRPSPTLRGGRGRTFALRIG